jgi:predicted nucleic acid-binding protein
MRIALDTNVLAYAEGLGDEPRCHLARDLIARLPIGDVVIPVQVLGELYRVLCGKGARPAANVRDAALSWADVFAVADSTWEAMGSAYDLVVDHNLQIWDALIMSVAAEQKCRLLLSEDLQDGFTWRGVTVANPFSETKHPLLRAAMSL